MLVFSFLSGSFDITIFLWNLFRLGTITVKHFFQGQHYLHVWSAGSCRRSLHVRRFISRNGATPILLLSFSFILRCCFCFLLTCHNLREFQQWFDFVTGSLTPPPSLLWEAWWRRPTLSWDRQVETKRPVHICQKFSKNAAMARSWLKIRSYLRLTLEIECTWCWSAPLS